MTGFLDRLSRGARLALFACVVLAGCGTPEDGSPSPAPSRPVTSALVGDGRLEANEQCDDGNAVSGDGCSATGTIESGYLCRVPGRACSLASLCGNNVINSGEACDDGNTTQSNNGCSSTCGLSRCGDGVVSSRQWPNFDQETCDDGNVIDDDGCSALCNVEASFGCTGSPSRCVPSGIALFNTGVNAQGRRLEAGADPHWHYAGTTTGAALGVRGANDWPEELQNARFMAAPDGADVCVYHDFLIPSTAALASFHLDIAMFNDNQFSSALVNGVPRTPVVISEPAGQPWQKNIVRRFTSPFRAGLNRITLCNDNAQSPPNAFRYLIVDAFDDLCGDGVISSREACDDGNTANDDGCSRQCTVEPGRVCSGAPSSCVATCGNGVVNVGEECDDGDTDESDGCDASCRVETGYACPPAPLVCAATCGNGILNPGEQCDDSGTSRGDGCSPSCRIEPGFDCVGAPSTCMARCGNGSRDPGELCDDGNRRAGDGCSNACTLELGYACPIAGVPCVVTCGDGDVDPGETCDDGNLVGEDGCSTECAPEVGYACSRPAAGPSVCTQSCGNGTLDANETCDDGNVMVGDGCSRSCTVEPGFSCSGAPSTCSTTCGDGQRAGTESCDDGNSGGGDGCSATCAVESGFTCPDPGTVCFQTCGNGVRDYASEVCDDGNTAAGDGCGATCLIETGFVCAGAPSVCVPFCGDGNVATGESCDDGNATAGDGCSARCRREAGEACTTSAECEGTCSPITHLCTDDDVAPPAPVIASPESEATITDATPTITGTAEPLAHVEIFIDDVSVATVAADASGAFEHTLTTPLAIADHAVRAVATDLAGNVGPSSAAVAFAVVGCLGDGDCVQGQRCDLESLACVPIVTMPDAGVEMDAGTDADVTVDGGDGAVSGGGCDCGVADARGGGRPSSFAWVLAAVVGARLTRRRARRV